MDVLPRSLLPHLIERVLIRSTQFKALTQYPTKNTEMTALKVVTLPLEIKVLTRLLDRLILKITLEIKY